MDPVWTARQRARPGCAADGKPEEIYFWGRSGD
jgi:hypothetical protein